MSTIFYCSPLAYAESFIGLITLVARYRAIQDVMDVTRVTMKTARVIASSVLDAVEILLIHRPNMTMTPASDATIPILADWIPMELDANFWSVHVIMVSYSMSRALDFIYSSLDDDVFLVKRDFTSVVLSFAGF